MPAKQLQIVGEFIQSLYESNALFEMDSKGIITSVSQPFQHKFQATQSFFLQRPIGEFSQELAIVVGKMTKPNATKSFTGIFPIKVNQTELSFRITLFGYQKTNGWYCSGICHNITHLIEQTQFLEEKRKKIENYTSCLIELARDKNIFDGIISNALEKITMVAAEQLHVTRISIWEYNAQTDSICCKKLYQKQEHSFQDGLELFAKDYPIYFNAVREEKIIDASRARLHPETSEYTENYLLPLDIYSMLDVPYFFDGTLAGIICCEHQKEIKEWDGEDILFVKGLADLLSIAYKAMIKRRDEEKIRIQKEEIEKQNQALIQQKEYINNVNHKLEMLIHEKNIEVIQKDTQLSEYAFINSHLLRSPLASIKGLVSLLEHQPLDESSKEMVGLLKQSAEKLDDIIHQITEVVKTKPS